MHDLPLFYKALQGFYNVSKTYLRQCSLQKLLKMWNHRKTRNPFIYAGSRAYLPQHCLYFLPLPHGVYLKLPCNFFILKWAFLLKKFNNLFIKCKKVMSNLLTMEFKRI